LKLYIEKKKLVKKKWVLEEVSTAATEAATELQDKCTKPSARIASKKRKSPLNQMASAPSIVKIAMQNESRKDIKKN
jgi:hypothetical protein